MSDAHPQTVQWLLEERERHLRYGRHERVTLVDAELDRLGHRVAPRKRSDPELEPEPETAEQEAPAEDAAEPKPRRRGGRPRLPRDEQGNIIRPTDGSDSDG